MPQMLWFNIHFYCTRNAPLMKTPVSFQVIKEQSLGNKSFLWAALDYPDSVYALYE